MRAHRRLFAHQPYLPFNTPRIAALVLAIALGVLALAVAAWPRAESLLATHPATVLAAPPSPGSVEPALATREKAAPAKRSHWM